MTNNNDKITIGGNYEPNKEIEEFLEQEEKEIELSKKLKNVKIANNKKILNEKKEIELEDKDKEQPNKQ